MRFGFPGPPSGPECEAGERGEGGGDRGAERAQGGGDDRHQHGGARDGHHPGGQRGLHGAPQAPREPHAQVCHRVRHRVYHRVYLRAPLLAQALGPGQACATSSPRRTSCAGILLGLRAPRSGTGQAGGLSQGNSCPLLIPPPVMVGAPCRVVAPDNSEIAFEGKNKIPKKRSWAVSAPHAPAYSTVHVYSIAFHCSLTFRFHSIQGWARRSVLQSLCGLLFCSLVHPSKKKTKRCYTFELFILLPMLLYLDQSPGCSSLWGKAPGSKAQVGPCPCGAPQVNPSLFPCDVSEDLQAQIDAAVEAAAKAWGSNSLSPLEAEERLALACEKVCSAAAMERGTALGKACLQQLCAMLWGIAQHGKVGLTLPEGALEVSVRVSRSKWHGSSGRWSLVLAWLGWGESAGADRGPCDLTAQRRLRGLGPALPQVHRGGEEGSGGPGGAARRGHREARVAAHRQPGERPLPCLPPFSVPCVLLASLRATDKTRPLHITLAVGVQCLSCGCLACRSSPQLCCCLRTVVQLRGRSGRQGDPGSSRFFLSLEDNLFRIFGGDRITVSGHGTRWLQLVL